MRYHHFIMRTTVDIDPHLLRRLREEAKEQGVTFKAFLNRTLMKGLDESGATEDAYACPTYSMGTPRQPLERALRVADALHDEEVARELELRK